MLVLSAPVAGRETAVAVDAVGEMETEATPQAAEDAPHSRTTLTTWKCAHAHSACSPA